MTWSTCQWIEHKEMIYLILLCDLLYKCPLLKLLWKALFIQEISLTSRRLLCKRPENKHLYKRSQQEILFSQNIKRTQTHTSPLIKKNCKCYFKCMLFCMETLWSQHPLRYGVMDIVAIHQIYKMDSWNHINRYNHPTFLMQLLGEASSWSFIIC